MKTSGFLFFLFALLYLTIGIILFGLPQLNNVSIGAITLSLVTIILIFQGEQSKEATLSPAPLPFYGIVFHPINTVKHLQVNNLSGMAIGVLIANFVLGIIGLLLVTNKISATDRIITSLNSIGILSLLITQVGGWFFQACLIYMLAYLLGAKATFEKYLVLVGLGYVGFLLLTLSTIIINYFYLPAEVSPDEFNELLSHSMLHGMIGKAGEYWTLAIIAAGIFYIEDNFSIRKSLLASVLPSLLLLSLKILFHLAVKL